MENLHSDSFETIRQLVSQWQPLKPIPNTSRYKISLNVEGMQVECSLKLLPREITSIDTKEKCTTIDCMFSVRPAEAEVTEIEGALKLLPVQIFVHLLPEIVTLINLHFESHPNVSKRFDLCISAEGGLSGNFSNTRFVGKAGKYTTSNLEEVRNDIDGAFSQQLVPDLKIIRGDVSLATESTSYDIGKALKEINDEELTEFTIARAVALCFIDFAIRYDGMNAVDRLIKSYSEWIEKEDASVLPIEIVRESVIDAIDAIKGKLTPGASSPHYYQEKVLNDLCERLNSTDLTQCSVGECMFIAHAMTRVCTSLSNLLSDDEINMVSTLEGSLHDLSLVKRFEDSLNIPPKLYVDTHAVAQAQWELLSGLSSGAFQVLVSFCDFGGLILFYGEKFPSNKIYRGMQSNFLDERSQVYMSDVSEEPFRKFGNGWAKPLVNLVGAVMWTKDAKSSPRNLKVVINKDAYQHESLQRFLSYLKNTPLKAHVLNIEEKIGEVR